MHHMVRRFGIPDAKGRTSFRHTIHKGQSSHGFFIDNESNRITVRHPGVSDIVWPYWTHDRLITAFAAKFRRLITVRGSKRKNQVCYEQAYLYEEPKTTQFAEAVHTGIIAIDFDARTNPGTKNSRGLRNHGTKFRIAYDDLRHIYEKRKKFG